MLDQGNIFLQCLGRCPIIAIMQSFTEIVESWGRAELAADLGVPKERTRQWSRDDTIHAKYWRGLLEKAPERGIRVSPELLIDLAARD